MMQISPALAISRLNIGATLVAMVVSLFLPPIGYGLIAYTNLDADTRGDARAAVEIVEQIARQAPKDWITNRAQAQAALSKHIHLLDNPGTEQLRLVDRSGDEIAAIGTAPGYPFFTQTAPFFVDEKQLGTIEIRHPLTFLFVNMGLLSLVGMALAALSYAALHVIPLRQMEHDTEILRRRERELSFANSVLAATTESSLDAILIVDDKGRIVSYTRQFIEMWRVPRGLVEARDDEPVLAVVTSRMKDEAGFLARVKYLYDHPDEQSQETLETKDGRTIERFSRTLWGTHKEYLGRVWFFRDVTERELAQNRIKFANTLLKAEIESAPDALVVIHADGDRVSFNRKFVELWGISPEIARTHENAAILPIVRAQLADPEAFVRDIDYVRTHADAQIRGREMMLKDGRCLEYSGGAIRGEADNALGRIWFFRDITDRKTAIEQLRQREALLHAVATSAAELLTASSLDEAIRNSLEIVGKTVTVDRIVVLERPALQREAPLLRYLWESPGIPATLDKSYLGNPLFHNADILAWEAPLFAGKTIMTDAKTATGDVGRFFADLGIKQVVVVPIMIDGKFWGQIGFDSCQRQRAWADYEVDILRTLAELIGNAIQRDRYVKEISNANQIVQSSPTILYRLRGVPPLPMIYISQNIRLFGYEPARFIADPTYYQNLVHPDDRTLVREKTAQLVDPGRRRGAFEFRLLNSDGDIRWVENRYTQIRDAAGRLVEIEGLLIDITARKAAEEKIAQLARTDPLTGLANRTTFIERLQQLFASARRGAPAFAVMYLDIDRFKDINDTLGHPIGDRFLVEVSRRLKACVRDSDLIGRLGGDEFAVLQTDIESSTDAGTLASKIRSTLSEPIDLDNNMLHMTASIGISVYGSSTGAPEDMLSHADIALYRAKEEGRDQFRFHSEALDKQVRDQVMLGDELRTALQRGEFRLHYQPQVELSTGEIAGMEALVRWQHPTRGLLAPAAFIDVAERTGAITGIGQWVLDQACRQMRLWRDQGCAPQTITVNISPAEIKVGDDFLAYVTATLAKWRLSPKDLELDVTESTLARVTLSQSDVLERLQKVGVRIAIDDFGTKYSSLDYLKTYRVSRLKIPPALTNTAGKNPDSAAMMRAIVGIARELDIEVMAQGVETESQWSLLTETAPVKKVQGYYYSEPVGAQRAEQMLRSGRVVPAAALAESAG
ncbi:MAG TPA: EAL domain-containing protein [Pseudolabrys sp.]|nr:EAL domain-containing protein [Pseudolabrys sp.]